MFRRVQGFGCHLFEYKVLVAIYLKNDIKEFVILHECGIHLERHATIVLGMLDFFQHMLLTSIIALFCGIYLYCERCIVTLLYCI